MLFGNAVEHHHVRTKHWTTYLTFPQNQHLQRQRKMRTCSRQQHQSVMWRYKTWVQTILRVIFSRTCLNQMQSLIYLVTKWSEQKRMIVKRRNEPVRAREFHPCEARQSGSTSLIGFQIFLKKHFYPSSHMVRDKASETCSVEKEFVPFSSLHFALPLKRGLTWINSIIINSLILN